MARRRRVKRRRSPRSVSLLNMLEAYTYGSILSMGIAGTSPFGFFSGEGDIGIGAAGSGYKGQVVGADQISLQDLIRNPGLSLNAMGKNLEESLIPMAVQSMITAVSFKFGRRLLRRPLSSINRNLVRPALGKGVRI